MSDTKERKIGHIHGFSYAPDGWPSDWPESVKRTIAELRRKDADNETAGEK